MISTVNIIQRLLLATCITIVVGILIHDTKFDRALLLSLPFASAVVGASVVFDGGTPHTHVEKASFSRVISTIPRIQPREEKSYAMPKYRAKNTNYFGDAGVIWPHA